MYKTRGSRAWCVGFRGYCGGFANRFVREESGRGDDFGEKYPVAEAAADQIGVFADETETGPLGEVAFQQRAGVHIPERSCSLAAEFMHKRGERLRQIPGMTPSLLSLPTGCAFRLRCAHASAACEVEPAFRPAEGGRELRCFHPMELVA